MAENDMLIGNWLSTRGRVVKDSILLKQIWGGLIEVRGPDDASPLARVLDVLLAVDTVSLVSKGGSTRPIAMMENVELMAGATLGDILVEELGIEVAKDAVILIEPQDMADADAFCGAELGQALSSVLVDVANCVALPLVETKAFSAPSDRILSKKSGQTDARPVSETKGLNNLISELNSIWRPSSARAH